MPRHFKVQLRMFGILVWCGVVLLSGLSVSEAAGPGVLWQSYLSGDGIPSGTILSIAAASDGAIWFGTDAGAARYDGSWKTLTVADNLPSGRIRAIAQSADGAIWFGTDAGVAQRSVDGQCCQVWTTAHGLPDNDVRALAIGEHGPADAAKAGVWVGTTRGLVFLDGERVIQDAKAPAAGVQALSTTGGDELFVSLAGRGVWRRGADGVWQALPVDNLVSEGPLALYAGPDDRIWAGTGDGLVVYGGDRWQRFPLLDDDRDLRVLAILQDSDRGLWVGTEHGAFYDEDARPGGIPLVRFRAQHGGLANDYVRALAGDGNASMWFGTIGGASRYAGRTWRLIRDGPLAGRRVNTVLVDSTGRVWAGTERDGLARWEGGAWQLLAADDGLPDPRILSIFEDEAGRVWVSTGGGVGYFAGAAQATITWLADAGLTYSFAQDSSGAVWLAADDGLYRWTREAGLERLPDYAGQRVNALYQATDGTLWAGTQEMGLLYLVDATWLNVTDAEGGKPLFNDIVVNGIGETEDGSLWVGTYNDGLWKYRGGRWERADADLASPKILTLSVTRRDVWVGTRQGLARHDGRTWQTYDGDVLPDPSVLAVAPAEDGTVWIGTLAGLVHYRPEVTPPVVSIQSVNLRAPQGGWIQLVDDSVHDVKVCGGDLTTRPEDLVYLVQVEGVDVVPQVHREPLITSYANYRLTSGVHRLRVQARDTAFNYSQAAEVDLVVPRMVVLPGGHRERADVVFPVLGLGIVALGAMVMAGSIGLQARARNRRLEAASTARQREALARGFNPYIAGEPVREPDMFFGRDDLLRRIFNALHQNSIMIHGARRMGKTTVLYQLADQLREADDAEWAFVPVYVDLEGTPQKRFFYTLMEAIWGGLQSFTLEDAPRLSLDETKPEAYDNRAFSADLRAILDCLKEVVAPRKVRVILLLDEMDVVSSYDTVIQQQLRRIFMSPLAVNLGAVVAGIQISKAWDRIESPWYNMFNEILLEPLAEDDARRLLVEPVTGVYAWDPAAIGFVLAQAEGYPHRLQQYALEAVNHMLAAQRLLITLDDVMTAHEILERERIS